MFGLKLINKYFIAAVVYQNILVRVQDEAICFGNIVMPGKRREYSREATPLYRRKLLFSKGIVTNPIDHDYPVYNISKHYKNSKRKMVSYSLFPRSLQFWQNGRGICTTYMYTRFGILLTIYVIINLLLCSQNIRLLYIDQRQLFLQQNN